jgi:putative RNA 2'-phosphotransferase
MIILRIISPPIIMRLTNKQIMNQLTTNQIKISKSISLYLRHNPDKLNIKLDLNGWTNLDEFCDKLTTKFKTEVTEEVILELMEMSPKKRFEIDSPKRLIRAKYGHSIEVSPEYAELTTPIIIYHGTALFNKESIIKHGIISQSRQFVHMSSDKDLAILTAKRWSKDIIIFEINTTQMLKDGIKIYNPGESVYLTKMVNPKYLIYPN